MNTVLIISYSPLHSDPRILRQIQALKDNYKILTIGNTSVNNDDIVHYNTSEPPRPIHKRTLLQKIRRRLILYIWLIRNYIWLIRNYNGYYSIMLARKLNFYYILKHRIETPDVIIANDWTGLYLASTLKTKYSWQAKIYFDAHEYAPKEIDSSFRWRLLMQPVITNALKKCKLDINIMSTVCDGIAREYERFFGFPNSFVRVVTNAAEYNSSLKPTAIGMRAEGGMIRLIHHGGAMKIRRLELMINMMNYLDPDKYELTFMLVKSDPEYYGYLTKISRTYKNIRFIEPVSFSEIINTLNNYDIGIFLLLPDIFNYKYALPNKLFEYIQARLAIAIGPSIEMVKIVERYNLGIYSEDFFPESLAKRIAQITPEKIMEYKKNADKYAKELSAEENINMIRSIVAELAGD